MSDVTVSISLTKQQQGRLYMQHLAAKKTVKALLEQRDELLASLKGLLAAYEDPGNTGSTHEDKVQAARDAISKAAA